MLKRVGRWALRRLGYEVVRCREPEPLPVGDEHLYGRVPHVVFTPWAGSAGELTTLTPARLWTLRSVAEQQVAVEGSIVECGVYQGGSALLLARLLPGRTLHLFDSFQGLSTPTRHDTGWEAGHFGDTAASNVADLLAGHDARIHQGWIPESFSGVETGDIALAHVDLDLYEPTVAALDHLWPRVVAGGVVVIDDYGFPSCVGVRRAVDQFMAGRTDGLGIYTPTAQYVIVHR